MKLLQAKVFFLFVILVTPLVLNSIHQLQNHCIVCDVSQEEEKNETEKHEIEIQDFLLNSKIVFSFSPAAKLSFYTQSPIFSAIYQDILTPPPKTIV